MARNEVREALMRYVGESLPDQKLLAELLNMDVDEAQALLRQHPLETLPNLEPKALTKVKNMTEARVARLIAAFELSRRALKVELGISPSINRPADVIPYITDIRDQMKEHFVALFLNARNQVIRREDVSVGSLNASLVHPREVFAPACNSAAASVILAHNHPSGDVTPSREDIELTRRMVQAGEIMGIEVLDHVIIAAKRFLSMKEANLF